jgi:hypothetical protein
MNLLKTPHQKILEEAGASPLPTPGILNTPKQMLFQESGLMPKFSKGGDLSSKQMEAALIFYGKTPPKFKYADGKSVGYGLRIDNTPKDKGFMGELPGLDGSVMTELSVGEPGTDETFRPSIVPNMHPAEYNYMEQTGKVPTDAYPISQKHADQRIQEGKSPFWNEAQDTKTSEPLHPLLQYLYSIGVLK